MSEVDRGDDFAPAEEELEVKTQAADDIPPKEDAPPADDKTTEDDPPRDDKGRFIPKSRFDEVIGKERAAREMAERRAAELEEHVRASQVRVDTSKLEEEIEGFEKKYTVAVMQGDDDEAARIMKEIRLRERHIQMQEAERLSSRTMAQTKEQVLVEAAIEKLVASYPELDDRSDSYSQALTDDVLDWQGFYISQKGMAPSKALIEAARRVMDGGGSSRASLRDAQTGDRGADRKAAAVDRALDASRKQPPSTTKVGADSDKYGVNSKVDYKKLTEAEREALPEATRARLRGDYFEGE